MITGLSKSHIPLVVLLHILVVVMWGEGAVSLLIAVLKQLFFLVLGVLRELHGVW